MTLPELYEQQQIELENFKAMRDKAWQQLQKEQQEITAAFGSKENLPDDIGRRFEQQLNNYNEEWAMNDGHRHKELAHQHEQQRQQVSGHKSQSPIIPPNDNRKPDTDHLTEKQIELQKIIRQQQAIKARNLQKKRGR
ncbi:asparagine synthetase A [Mucilaginibacter sp. UYNi724]